jgi:hypothetical protein
VAFGRHLSAAGVISDVDVELKSGISEPVPFSIIRVAETLFLNSAVTPKFVLEVCVASSRREIVKSAELVVALACVNVVLCPVT